MRRLFFGWLLALICLTSPGDADAGFSGLYVFGDSLSDSGNNAAILFPNVTPVPISGNAFTPTFPYASGRYTNGEVWAQMLASSLGTRGSAAAQTTPLAERGQVPSSPYRRASRHSSPYS